MSAYVVKDDVINVIVRFITENNTNYSDKYYYALNPLRCKGFLALPAEQLGAELFKLNCQSVEARYGEGQAKEFRPLDYQYKQPPMCNVYRVLTCISEFLYQSCEGSFNEDDLYLALEAVQGNIALRLVTETKEYQSALEHWG